MLSARELKKTQKPAIECKCQGKSQNCNFTNILLLLYLGKHYKISGNQHNEYRISGTVWSVA